MKHGFLDGYDQYDTSGGYGDRDKWKSAFQERLNMKDAEAILKDQNLSPWAILGVAPGVSEREIKTAFRAKVMEWHPDRNQHRLAEAEARTKEILAAYTKLC